MSKDSEVHHISIPAHLAGKRLDRALAELLPEYSRSRIQSWIRAGQVTVDGRCPKPRDEAVEDREVVVEPRWEAADRVQPQPMELDVVYRDADLLVINKPVGMVVHPGAGNPDQTLQNGLLHYDPELAVLPRGGLVHRLDKDTSGILLVARTPRAHTALVRAMQARDIHREYVAVVQGVVEEDGRVNQPLGPNPTDRERFAVRPSGRQAATRYRVWERFAAHTALRVVLETGRTHQIRVHMSWLGYPLVGDPVYGRKGGRADVSPALREQLDCFRHQALHAARLRLAHPITARPLEFESALPLDMENLLEALRNDA